MRERVERNGGSFALISQRGCTTLIASFPLGDAA
jgi:signal transduction histidine kinase